MKPENLLDAMQHISPDLIAEAKPLPKPAELREAEPAETVRIRIEEGSKPMKTITQHIMTGVSIAAAVAVCAGFGIFIAKNGRSGGLNEPSAAVTTETTAPAVTPAAQNYLGGTGELQFSQLGRCVFGCDNDYWYILDNVIYAIPKSSGKYIPIGDLTLKSDLFTVEGEQMRQFFVDNFGQLYGVIARSGRAENPDVIRQGATVFRISADGKQEQMGDIWFDLPGAGEYRADLDDITISTPDFEAHRIWFSGYFMEIEKPGQYRFFEASAELMDGKFDTVEGDSLTISDADGSVPYESLGEQSVAWKGNEMYRLSGGVLWRSQPFSSQSIDTRKALCEPPIKELVQAGKDGEIYSLGKDGNVIYRSDVTFSDPQVVWNHANDTTDWTKIGSSVDSEILSLLGVFDGRIWAVMKCDTIMVLDPDTGESQFLYNEDTAEPRDLHEAETSEERAVETAKRVLKTYAAFTDENKDRWDFSNLNAICRSDCLATYIAYAAQQFGRTHPALVIDSDYDVSSEVGWLGRYRRVSLKVEGAEEYGRFTFIMELQGDDYRLIDMIHEADGSLDQQRSEIFRLTDPEFWITTDHFEPFLQKIGMNFEEEYNRLQSIRSKMNDVKNFADTVFREWVEIETGAGGDMHNFTQNGNLADYLNYASAAFANVLKINTSEEEVSLMITDAEYIPGETPYYRVTGSGLTHAEYSNGYEGNSGFGVFTFLIAQDGAYRCNLLELTHSAMDSADMNFRPDYIYNEKQDPDFWAKPECYSPLMEQAGLNAPAQTSAAAAAVTVTGISLETPGTTATVSATAAVSTTTTAG